MCYTDVRVAKPPETMVKWAFYIAMPWIYRKAVSLIATIFEADRDGTPSPYPTAHDAQESLYGDVLRRRCYQHLQRRLDGIRPAIEGYCLPPSSAPAAR